MLRSPDGSLAEVTAKDGHRRVLWRVDAHGASQPGLICFIVEVEVRSERQGQLEAVSAAELWRLQEKGLGAEHTRARKGVPERAGWTLDDIAKLQ